MNVLFLECSRCKKRYEKGKLYNVCSDCGKPLLVRYDLDRVGKTLTPRSLLSKVPSLWRYREVLPVERDESVVSLGEGWTPLLEARRLGEGLGMPDLYIKDESSNPTGSFKARGMTVAVSMARELGVKRLAVPSAGNAAAALAAYAARGGLEAHIYMPRDVPKANIIECMECGADVVLVDGFINDCARRLAEKTEKEGWFDLSTLNEPYRIEGKKTMGYELAEQLDWALPDVIFYPTGGGTGLIGMWKAFEEMQQMGWVGAKRPRMISVQAEGCAPIVSAFEAGTEFARPVADPTTVAAGLRVPVAIGDFMILEILRQSEGCAIAVSDRELTEAIGEIGAAEGLFAAPEGAACLPALRKMLETGGISRDERVVLFNTGSGLKYLELWDKRTKELN